MNNQEFFSTEQQKQQNEWLSADAWLKSEYRKKVKPFVLRIVNSGIARNDIDIGNAYNSWDATIRYDGVVGITRSSVIPGVTYREFLLETENKPFKISQVLVISTTSGQLNNVVNLIKRDADGTRKDEIFYATIDPYQNLTDRVLIDKEFIWDGYTTLRFATVNEGATINIFIWKKEQFSAVDILSGGKGKLGYTEPRIIRAIPLVRKF